MPKMAIAYKVWFAINLFLSLLLVVMGLKRISRVIKVRVSSLFIRSGVVC